MKYSFKYVNENLGKDLVCAEIGVMRGEGSVVMLENMSIQKLFLIDPYLEYKDNIVGYVEQYRLDIFKEEAKNNLSKYENKYEFLYLSSKKSVSRLSDVNFDFIYIDGNHDNVEEDFRLWINFIKEGGVLAGHDYNNKEVKDTINGLFCEYHQKFPLYKFKNDSEDWLIHKLT